MKNMSAKGLTVLVLLPLALSMNLQTPQLGLAVADAPKLGLAIVDNPHMAQITRQAIVGHNAEASISEMETMFERSQEVHVHSMDEITKHMTLPGALEVAAKDPAANTSSFKQLAGLLTSKASLRAGHDVDGFGGLDGARKMLNDMIHEAMLKYDKEIARCTDYYSKQCALMEQARGQISAASYIAATSRGLILDAQQNINHLTLSIPETKLELKDHNRKCKDELTKLNKQLKIIMGDIALITMILEMSDCDKKLLQVDNLQMFKCHDNCTGKDYVTFSHKGLQAEVHQLGGQSQDLMAQVFSDLFDDGQAVDSAELLQVEDSRGKPKKKKGKKTPPTVKKIKYNSPPVPKTKVPSNPCSDPGGGAPATSKRGAKCTLKKSPQCYKLQGRFLQIQGEVADTRDALMDQISDVENDCQDTKKTLETVIENDNSALSSHQTKLAAATEKEASAGETGRQVAKENAQYEADLKKQMKVCNTNYVGYEEEMCALRKIRGDLFKKMTPGHKGFFQDCEVAKWSPEACTKKCAGGEQKLTRNVLAHPAPLKEPGCKCLPLSAKRRCNLHPCPINCKLQTWSGWNKCSAKCGGGLQQRVRDVKTPAQYGGKPCSATSEAKQCNVAACEKDCVLRKWTKWTKCSKDCDGGSKKRERMIKEPVQGSGKCADKWSVDRLQYEMCNQHSCKVADPTKVMKCNKTLDVVLLVDQGPGSGKDGFAMEIKAATNLVEAFQNKGPAQFALVSYTGPRTWSGVSKCTGKSTKKVDMEKTCKVVLAQHFSNDVTATKAMLTGFQFQPGCKLLSLALMTVQAEFPLGRKEARTIVIVFIDGQPLSFRKTLIASRAIRKKARLVWVPVLKFSPLKNVKEWASRRWQENIVQVKESKGWALPETGTHIIANICPKSFPKVKVSKPTKKR